jgi:hypothetical protein
MSLDALIRDSLSLGHTITLDRKLQVRTVQHAAWDGVTYDSNGQPVISPPVNVSCIVEITNELIQTASGEMSRARSKLTFLQPRHITTRDIFTLPDGSTGPILDIKGVVDPSTNMPYAPEVYLG